MQSYNLQKRDDNAGIQTTFECIKMMAVLLGMICIVIGLVGAVKLSFLIYGVLESPDSMIPSLEKWGEALGGEALTLTLNGDDIPLAKVTAVSVLGSGVTILAVIALGLISCGARLVSWVLFDRESVKRLLKQTLGQSNTNSEESDNF